MWMWFIVHKSDIFNRFRSYHTNSEWFWESAIEFESFYVEKMHRILLISQECLTLSWISGKKTNKQTNTWTRNNTFGMTRALCGISLYKQKQRKKKGDTMNEINDKEYKFRYYWRSAKKKSHFKFSAYKYRQKNKFDKLVHTNIYATIKSIENWVHTKIVVKKKKRIHKFPYVWIKNGKIIITNLTQLIQFFLLSIANNFNSFVLISKNKL